jgi:hypothetical protein
MIAKERNELTKKLTLPTTDDDAKTIPKKTEGEMEFLPTTEDTKVQEIARASWNDLIKWFTTSNQYSPGMTLSLHD